jgi:hypothetical protein
MGAFSKHTRRMVLDSLLRGEAWSPPKEQYMGLFTEDGKEVEGPGYARLPVGPAQWVAVHQDAEDAPERVTNDRLEWAAARGAAWSDGAPIAGWRTFDAPAGGQQILAGAFKPAKAILDGDVFYVPAGNIVVELA